jgi:hypothetical protein
MVDLRMPGYRRVFWMVVKDLAHAMGGPLLVSLVDQGPDVAPGTERVSRRVRVLPTGRGTVLVKKGCRAHIMPFADGKIINPGDLRAYTLREYRRAHPGWSVLEIRRMNTGEK